MTQKISLMNHAAFAMIAVVVMIGGFSYQAFAQQQQQSSPPATLQPQAPELKNQQGRPMANAVAGELAVISATIASGGNATESQNFIAMVEARSSVGITQLLEFQTGQVSEDGSVEIGISWTPDEPGNYQLRTFLLSDLKNPEVLSAVTTKEITVMQEE
ncbi:MAG TPA: hypothetical protein VJP79_04845 [Nitrososphaera sp.]|nr:hypothetical protein [Nitrososphaera sp.]